MARKNKWQNIILTNDGTVDYPHIYPFTTGFKKSRYNTAKILISWQWGVARVYNQIMSGSNKMNQYTAA